MPVYELTVKSGNHKVYRDLLVESLFVEDSFAKESGTFRGEQGIPTHLVAETSCTWVTALFSLSDRSPQN